MNSPVDMRDCEQRDEFGHPHLPWAQAPYAHGPSTRPKATVDVAPGGAITAPVSFRQDTDNSNGKQVNPAVPWIIATGVCALSVGLALGVALMSDGQIRAEGRAIRAEVRMDFAERIAKLEARVGVAEYEASVAKQLAQQNARSK